MHPYASYALAQVLLKSSKSFKAIFVALLISLPAVVNIRPAAAIPMENP